MTTTHVSNNQELLTALQFAASHNPDATRIVVGRWALSYLRWAIQGNSNQIGYNYGGDGLVIFGLPVQYVQVYDAYRILCGNCVIDVSAMGGVGPKPATVRMPPLDPVTLRPVGVPPPLPLSYQILASKKKRFITRL